MKLKEERLLRLWKIRQEREGVDVSKVKTLAQAKKFYAKKAQKEAAKAEAEKRKENEAEVGKQEENEAEAGGENDDCDNSSSKPV
jgi:hypothetical protein